MKEVPLSKDNYKWRDWVGRGEWGGGGGGVRPPNLYGDLRFSRYVFFFIHFFNFKYRIYRRGYLKSLLLGWDNVRTYHFHEIILNWYAARTPKNPILGPKMGPKYHIAVITVQKLSQVNENNIWIGYYDQLWYIGTIFMELHQISIQLDP